MKRLTVYVPDGVAQELERVAWEEERDLSDLLRAIIRRGLSTWPRKRGGTTQTKPSVK